MEDKNKVLGELARSKTCCVTVLALMMVSRFGLECLDWDPEIVLDSFCRAYDISRLPKLSQDKLQAGLALIGTNAFSGTLEGFLACTRLMDNGRFDSDEAPFCDIMDCAWSVYEYRMLLQNSITDKDDEQFAPEIAGYIREVGRLHGMTQFPFWLDFADSPVVPDTSGDISLFEAYNARQQEYKDMIQETVREKAKVLSGQLKLLERTGIISKPA